MMITISPSEGAEDSQDVIIVLMRLLSFILLTGKKIIVISSVGDFGQVFDHNDCLRRVSDEDPTMILINDENHEVVLHDGDGHGNDDCLCL